MASQENIAWLRERLQASLALEPRDPSELLVWLAARRQEVPFSADLIPLREVADWRQAWCEKVTSQRPETTYARRRSLSSIAS